MNEPIRINITSFDSSSDSFIEMTRAEAGFVSYVAWEPAAFDGHCFEFGIGGNLWALRMAYDARRGDKVSAELLNTFRVKILDKDDKYYWPMEAGPEGNRPNHKASEGCFRIG